MANNPYVNKVIVNNQTIIDLSGDTVDAAKLLDGYTAHDKSGAPITGNIQSLAAQTITPALTEQEIAAGKYLSGNQTIAPITAQLLTQIDPDFVAENIKKDVNLFGLVGNLEGVSAAYGTFTPSSTVLSYTVNHNLGALPDLVAFFMEGLGSPATLSGRRYMWGVAFSDGLQKSYFYNSGSFSEQQTTHSMYTTYSGSEMVAATSVTTTQAVLGNPNVTGSTKPFFQNGKTYRWVVAKF